MANPLKPNQIIAASLYKPSKVMSENKEIKKKEDKKEDTKLDKEKKDASKLAEENK